MSLSTFLLITTATQIMLYILFYQILKYKPTWFEWILSIILFSSLVGIYLTVDEIGGMFLVAFIVWINIIGVALFTRTRFYQKKKS